VHAGVYYPPGSLKARLCREGARRLKGFCAARELPYREIGKVVVARSAAEVPRLRDIEARATANGVPGLRWLGPAELAGIEPHVRGVAALHSPSTAITDYRAIARAMAGDLEAAGGRLRLGQRVTGIGRQGDRAVVRTAAGAVTVDRLVICAGLQSDRVAALAGDGPAPAIVPFRGEYYRLVPDRAYLISGLVYPVPDPAYPFLGVHFTPRVDGTVDIGPNAVLATAREGYRRRDVNLADLRDVLGWPGFRRLARVHWRAGLAEARTSVSKKRFVAGAREYLPALSAADVVPAPAGVRAQAVDRDGSLVDDFRISVTGAVVSVRNAPSPAATSSLAIAEYIANQTRTQHG
jgi:L-2-hydroxyglutarate oxidase LhgO